MRPQDLPIEIYNYVLPPSSIAEFPLPIRDQSKLLVYNQGGIRDDQFKNVANHIPENTFILLNNTKVINARVLFTKPSGAQIELFCLESYQLPIQDALQAKKRVLWECLIGGASKWKKGQVLEKTIISNGQSFLLSATYIRKENDHFIIEFTWPESLQIPFSEILHLTGSVPLPPYIKRKAVKDDIFNYQTIFSLREGSVAAPTAALHFTENVFENFSTKNIRYDYLTLHVGAGTFKPVKSTTIEDHIMHSEPFSIRKSVVIQLLNAHTVLSVGTTSLRAIESMYWLGLRLIQNPKNQDWTLGQWEAYELMDKMPLVDYKESLKHLLKWMENNQVEEISCRTSLMVVPGYPFKIIKGLITNFHQPKSTLLVLISAFIGEDWKKVYSHALANNYRFLSYGDSSLLWRK